MKENMGSCSSGSSNTTSSSNYISCFSKDLVRGLAIVGLILILLVGTPEGKRATKTTTTATSTANFMASGSAGKFKGTDQVVVGNQKLVDHNPKLDRINYMSKRRVPNGPDPIHNRRAGKSGRLPGRA